MQTTERFLGIDYGSKRFGIAVSDPTNIIARGIGVVYNTPALYDEIGNYVGEFRITTIVVGMPVNLKGERGRTAEEVELFIAELQRRLPRVKIVPFDERFSSRQAQQTLLTMGVKKKKRQSKEIIDPMAAAIVLQTYLDGRKVSDEFS